MKIEKIKNYNQKILAIVGTIAILFAVLGLILFGMFIVNEISYNSYYEKDEGILSNEKIEELQKENMRQQVISYEIPKLIDSLNLVYIIPVTHKTLDNKEELLGMLNMYDKSDDKSDKRYSSRFYGSHNNLLIYDKNNETVKKLFDIRINFGAIDIQYFDNDILIHFLGATKDSFKDGVINLVDFKCLYIYSFKNKELKSVCLDNTDVINYNFINSNELLIKFGIDHNKDGKFNEFMEETIIKKFNFNKNELIDIIDHKINIELQKTLEGSE